MEEERVVITFGRTGKVMLDFVVKSLAFIATSTTHGVQWWRHSRQFSGETHWNKLMNSGDKLGIQELVNTEVNLDKLKAELEKYGIGFAFYQQPNSEVTHMAYAVRHENIVKQAFQEVLKDITQNPKDFANTIKKEPHEQKLDEKLKYYKAQERSEVKQASMQKQATAPKMDSKVAFDDFVNKFSQQGGKSL